MSRWNFKYTFPAQIENYFSEIALFPFIKLQFKVEKHSELQYSKPSADWLSEKRSSDFAKRIRQIDKYQNLTDEQAEEIRHSLRTFSLITYYSIMNSPNDPWTK